MNSRQMPIIACFTAGVLFLAAAAAGCSGRQTEIVYRTDSSVPSGDGSDASGMSAGSPEDSGASGDHPDAETEAVSEEIVVYVCGEVRDPGVYTLPQGSRICHALEAAGGLTEEADERLLNQAELLTDGEQITVYSAEEAQERMESAAGLTEGTQTGSGQSGAQESGEKRVNLNTADREELMTLPDIGEARAEAILAYRSTYGGFSSPEDLLNVEGIGTKRFEKLKKYIEV